MVGDEVDAECRMTSTDGANHPPELDICLSLFAAQLVVRTASPLRAKRPAMSQRDDDDDLEVGEREPLAGGYNDAEHPNTKYVSQ